MTTSTDTRKRDDHCTHPNQNWCDCDWCRYLRNDPPDGARFQPGTGGMLVKAGSIL
jgi:hypothetical protein